MSTLPAHDHIEARTSAVPAGPTLHTRLEAIRANVRLVRDRTPAEVMAVVKADAYGAGAAPVARAAVEAGATWIGTTSIEHAAALRASGIAVPILSWLNPSGIDGARAAHAAVDVAVASLDELRELTVPGIGAVRIHLHLDTGMARGGAPRSEWSRLIEAAARSERAGSIVVAGMMGHLPNAGRGLTAANRDAVARMREGIAAARAAGLSGIRHLAATAAALTDAAAQFDLVRVGAGLVGIDPSGSTRLHQALTLTAPVVHTVWAPGGTPVGYDGRHVTAEATHLSVVGVGYADGIPARLASTAEVGIGGRRHRVVGAVSMDQIVIDTGAIAYPRGTCATIFGADPQGPSVAEWAAWGSTIPHDIVTGIGPRVARSIA